MTYPVIIIGAGLSGLTAAYFLKSQNVEFLMLEARGRLGGRVYTENTKTHEHLEMGATWFGFKHEHLKKLLDDLKIEYFQQYNDGQSTLVFNSMSPPHHFEADKNAPPSYRIANGSKALIEKLSENFNAAIHFNKKVTSLTNGGNHIKVTTENASFTAKKVVLTLPPRLAAETIKFKPELSDPLQMIMRSTPTWMEDAIKFALTYKKPFWREKGKSGMVISQIAPVVEVYDHNNFSNDQFALVGFINPKLRDFEPKERKEQIITYLSDNLGKEVGDYIDYIEKDWSLDDNTAVTGAKVNMRPAMPTHF